MAGGLQTPAGDGEPLALSDLRRLLPRSSVTSLLTHILLDVCAPLPAEQRGTRLLSVVQKALYVERIGAEPGVGAGSSAL